MPYKNKEKKKEYMKAYLSLHKEEIRIQTYWRKKGKKISREGVRTSPVSEFKKGDRTYLGTKECLNCGKTYQITSGPQKYCQKCSPNKNAYRYMKIYGLNPEEHLSLKNKYNGMCWLCKKRKAIRVDHNHKTGEIRGVLCGYCNSSLSMIENEENQLEMLEKIKKYLNL